MGQVRRSEEGFRRLPGALGGVRLSEQFGRVQGEAWNAVSTILSGICVFGAVGLGLDHLFGTAPILLVAGILAGKGLGVYVIYARHFNAPDAQAPATAPPIAGWSKASAVAGARPEAQPKADLSAWPYTKGSSRAS